MQPEGRAATGNTLCFSGFTLDIAARRLLNGDVPVPIEPRVFDLIAYLIQHRERAVGKDELVSAIWGTTEVGDVGLAQAIGRARKCLGDAATDPRFIATFVRYGYRWIAETEYAEPVPATPPPASAAGLVAVDADPALVVPGAGAPAGRKWRRAAIAAVVSVLIVAMAWAGFALHMGSSPAGPASGANAASPAGGAWAVIAIAPVIEPRSDTLDAAALAGMADVLRADIQATGARIAPLSPDASRRLFALRDGGALSIGEAARDVGATHVLLVTLDSRADRWKAEVSLHAASGEAVDTAVHSRTINGAVAAVAVFAATLLDPAGVRSGPASRSSDAMTQARAVGLANLGNLEDAAALLEGVLRRDPDDHEARLEAGRYACRLRRDQACLAHLERLLDVTGNPRIAVRSRLELLLYWHRKGEFAKADGYLEDAERFNDDALDPHLRSAIASLRGMTAFTLGDMRTVFGVEIEAHRVNTLAGMREVAAFNLVRAAQAEALGIDRSLGIARVKAAADTLRALGAVEMHGRATMVLAGMLATDGRLDAASDRALEALAAASASQSSEWRGLSELQVGLVMLEKANVAKARKHLTEAIVVGRSIEDRYMVAVAELALVELADGAAQAAGLRAVSANDPATLFAMAPMERAGVLSQLAVLQAANGDTLGAGSTLRQLDALVQTMPATSIARDLREYTLARVLSSAARHGDALVHARNAWQARQRGSIPLHRRAVALVEVAMTVGRMEEAQQVLAEAERTLQPSPDLAAARVRLEAALRTDGESTSGGSPVARSL